jgi:hypothetical protein
MIESEKAKLLKRKAMLFQFLSFQTRTRESFWGDDDDDFQTIIDDILDQVIAINKLLLKYSND